ncbi:MAG: ATP-binding protein [Candidatus Sumerlaeia bacterium]
MKRNIIEIDEAKCNGCGKCVNACAEGALQMIDGKAKLVSDIYCDGLGACIGDCPTGALKVIEREADAFDEAAVEERVRDQQPKTSTPESGGCPAFAFKPSGGCPGSASRQFDKADKKPRTSDAEQPSELTHWPIQLHLAHPAAPQFQGADVLLAADCTAFALGSFHRDLLAGKSLLIACPKLDDTRPYISKLVALCREAKPRSITIARMEVPCCSSLTQLALAAVQEAGTDIAVDEVIVSTDGQIRSKNRIAGAPALH